jgi:hypothetical protein
MDIKQTLKDATNDSLSEESLNTIQEAIETKAQEAVQVEESKFELRLEAALAKQDTEYAEKLTTLLESIDKDHTAKMKMLLEGQDAKHTDMLKQLVKKYKVEYVEECNRFKEDFVNKVDNYFDIVSEKAFPTDELKVAVENTRYRHLVESIGKMIGVDNIKHDEIVKEGIMDAKSQIDTLKEKVEELKSQKAELVSEKVEVTREKLLNEKCEGLPKIKKTYMKKVLGNKSVDFITENFDYTLELYDAEETNKAEVLCEEAKQETKVFSEDIDRNEVIEEAKTEQPDFYLDAMRESEV